MKIWAGSKNLCLKISYTRGKINFLLQCLKGLPLALILVLTETSLSNAIKFSSIVGNK